MKRIVPLALSLSLLTACGKDAAVPTTPEAAATTAVKTSIAAEIDLLLAGAKALQAAAPTPDADGWNRTSDTAAVTAMENAWRTTRVSYEKIEGAIAVLFDGLDVSTDQRYDFFVEATPDTNLFDDQVVTGMHGIERIIWSDRIPDHVLTFESDALANYVAAAFPANQAEAADFKNKLCQKLVDDVQKMKDDFKPLALDASTAFRGVIGSMEEQAEKTHLAGDGTEESRYSQHTLADMRANLAGGRTTFEAFRAWLKVQTGGADLETKILAAFDRLDAKYDSYAGDSIPPVPANWNSENPNSNSPYGSLFVAVESEADPQNKEGLVSLLSAAADLMKIPQLPE